MTHTLVFEVIADLSLVYPNDQDDYVEDLREKMEAYGEVLSQSRDMKRAREVYTVQLEEDVDLVKLGIQWCWLREELEAILSGTAVTRPTCTADNGTTWEVEV